MIEYATLCRAIDDWKNGRRPSVPEPTPMTAHEEEWLEHHDADYDVELTEVATEPVDELDGRAPGDLNTVDPNTVDPNAVDRDEPDPMVSTGDSDDRSEADEREHLYGHA